MRREGKTTRRADAPGCQLITLIHLGRLTFTPPPLPPSSAKGIFTPIRRVIGACRLLFILFSRPRLFVDIMVR